MDYPISWGRRDPPSTATVNIDNQIDTMAHRAPYHLCRAQLISLYRKALNLFSSRLIALGNAGAPGIVPSRHEGSCVRLIRRRLGAAIIGLSLFGDRPLVAELP